MSDADSGRGDMGAAWESLRETWDDEAAHRAFLDWCATADRLGEAARRYRAVLDAAPDDAPAKAALEAVRKRAVARLTVATEERNRQWVAGATRTWIGLLVVLAVAVIVAFGIYWLTARR